MAISGGPDIVEDGLVLHLDAAEPLCFKGEPTTNLMPYSNGVAGRVNWPNGAYTHSIETTGEFAGWEKIVATTTGSTPDTVMRVGDVSCLANTEYTATMEFYSPYNTLKFNVGGSYGNWNGIRIGNSNRYYVTFTKNSTTGNQGWWLKTTSYTPANTAITNGVIYYRRAQFEQRGYYTNFVEGTRGSTVATGGGLLDLTNNGNNGTINRTSVPSAAFYSSNNGGYFSFDSGNDYINCGNDSSLSFGSGNFNLSLWIKTSSTSGSDWMGVIAKYSGGTGIWIQLNPSNRYVGFGWTGSNYMTSTTSVASGTWRYISCQRTSSTGGEIYVDGNLVMISSSLPTQSSDTSVQWDIGRINLSGRYFNGNISQASIYNRELTPQQILQNYNATKGRFGL